MAEKLTNEQIIDTLKQMTALVILECREIIAGYNDATRIAIIKRLFPFALALDLVTACKLLEYRTIFYFAACLISDAYQSFSNDIT